MRNLILMTVFILGGFLFQVNAQENDEAKKVVKGELIVTADDKGEITSVVLKKVEKFDDEQIVTLFIVKLDDTGKKMAQELKGKEVEVEAVVVEVEKDDKVENHMTVSKYKAAEAKAEKADMDL